MNALWPARTRKTISLTALIDVVFILLMFFMLTSSFSQWRAISLNTPVASEQTSDRPPQLLIIHSDGSFSQPGESGLPLQQAIDDFDHRHPVVLLPEEKTTVQTIVSALEQLKGAGIAQLSLGNTLTTGNR